MMGAQARMFIEVSRKAELSALTSSCRISRKGEGSYLDPETGVYTSDEILVYEGKCLVRPALRDYRQVDFGGEPVTMHIYDVRLPVDVTVDVLDVIEVTASADDALVGRELTVRDVPYDEWAVVRKVVAEEVR